MEKGGNFCCFVWKPSHNSLVLGVRPRRWLPLPWRSAVHEIWSLQPRPAVSEFFHRGFDNNRTISKISLRAIWHWFFHCCLKEYSPEPESEGNTDPSLTSATADLESPDFSVFSLTQRQARRPPLCHRKGHYFWVRPGAQWFSLQFVFSFYYCKFYV